MSDLIQTFCAECGGDMQVASPGVYRCDGCNATSKLPPPRTVLHTATHSLSEQFEEALLGTHTHGEAADVTSLATLADGHRKLWEATYKREPVPLKLSVGASIWKQLLHEARGEGVHVPEDRTAVHIGLSDTIGSLRVESDAYLPPTYWVEHYHDKMVVHTEKGTVVIPNPNLYLENPRIQLT